MKTTKEGMKETMDELILAEIYNNYSVTLGMKLIENVECDTEYWDHTIEIIKRDENLGVSDDFSNYKKFKEILDKAILNEIYNNYKITVIFNSNKINVDLVKNE